MQVVELGQRYRLALVEPGFDIVFVEALENLMVGEITDFQFVINKTLIHGFQHRREGRFYSTVFENRCQTVVLRLIIRQNEYSIVLLGVIVERFHQQVEILVEDGLRRSVELDGHTAFIEHLTAPLAVCAHRHKFVELVAIESHLRNGVGIGTLGCVCADGVYTLNGNSQIVKEINCRVAEKVGYRDAHIVIKAVVNVRDDGNTVGRVFSELTFNVESADAVNLVAKEIETERHLVGERENVDNAATNRVLARLIDEIDTLKTILVEQIDQKIVRQRITFAHHKSVGCKPVGRDDFFHHSLGIGDNNHRALR